MPQDSIVYAVARTRALETKLLNKEKLARIIEAPDAASGLKILTEYGYGGGRTDYEAMIDYELSEMSGYINSVTPNRYATGAFLLKYDCHNIKTIFKAKMLGISPDDLLTGIGTIDREKLKSAIEDGDFEILPPNMAQAARELKEKTELGQVPPQSVDLLLDNACFADMAHYASESGDEFVIECVRAVADLLNFRTVLRAKKGAIPLEKALVGGGSVPKERFIQCAEMQADEILIKTGIAKYGRAVNIEDYVKTGSTKVLEKQADDYILGLAKQKKYESFSIAPLIGYILAKEREAQAVRLIMIAKANGAESQMIQERLREQDE
ncbi:MAG: hypothetical protein GX860_10460 [Alcaligenaceae bacterium]|nr:hypothetical protein [Alcaligenaceae bacterium]